MISSGPAYVVCELRVQLFVVAKADRVLRANKRVLVQLLASRFTNNGEPLEWDSELEGYRGRYTRGLISGF